MSSSSRRLRNNPPVDKYFPGDSLVIGTLLVRSCLHTIVFSILSYTKIRAMETGAGVVIFHLATNRVVVCKDTRTNIWFLPKGRKDASEEVSVTAVREGFEESGYRNRLLPLPLPHLQPRPLASSAPYDIEPLATRLLPVATSYQYLLFWYAAETLPLFLEDSINASPTSAFASPESFPDITLREREMQDDGYEPKRHEGTGVDADEAFYVGVLMGVEEAMECLGGSSGDVVRRAWEGVKLRRKMEAEQEI
ncbi:hypothetical protein E4T39_02713 [Aureobasidium subglaciale]|nr:hypothetical protein E4T39_02713 [Aureobasidium subglaciale]